MVTSSNQAHKRKEMSSLTRIHRSGCSWIMSCEAVAFAFCLQIVNLDDFVRSAWIWCREKVKAKSSTSSMTPHYGFHRLSGAQLKQMQSFEALESFKSFHALGGVGDDGVAYRYWVTSRTRQGFLFLANCFSKWRKWVFFEFSSGQNLKFARFYPKFQQVAKNIEGC